MAELSPKAGAERIRAGFVAFATGDAVGAPWEGVAPGDLTEADLSHLTRREDWPLGATSDDTAQLLLAAETLCAPGEDPQRGFMERLAAGFDEMRGVGPTTTEAVRRWRESGALGATEGTTNGAAMRALAVGWATPSNDPHRRRETVQTLSRATHGGAGALIAAGVVAAIGTWSLEPIPLETICEEAVTEAEALRAELQADVPLDELTAAARGEWTPPSAGVSLDAIETTAAVVDVLRQADDVPSGIEAAIRLGGDTDTVAAIAAGILGSLNPEQVGQLPWLLQVQLPDPALLDRLAKKLWEGRGVSLQTLNIEP